MLADKHVRVGGSTNTPRQKELKVRFDTLGLVSVLRAKARSLEDGEVLPSPCCTKQKKQRKGAGVARVFLNMVKGCSKETAEGSTEMGGGAGCCGSWVWS